MKKKIAITGMLAGLLTFGLTLTGCPTEGSPSNSGGKQTGSGTHTVAGTINGQKFYADRKAAINGRWSRAVADAPESQMLEGVIEADDDFTITLDGISNEDGKFSISALSENLGVGYQIEGQLDPATGQPIGEIKAFVKERKEVNNVVTWELTGETVEFDLEAEPDSDHIEFTQQSYEEKHPEAAFVPEISLPEDMVGWYHFGMGGEFYKNYIFSWTGLTGLKNHEQAEIIGDKVSNLVYAALTSRGLSIVVDQAALSELLTSMNLSSYQAALTAAINDWFSFYRFNFLKIEQGAAGDTDSWYVTILIPQLPESSFDPDDILNYPPIYSRFKFKKAREENIGIEYLEIKKASEVSDYATAASDTIFYDYVSLSKHTFPLPVWVEDVTAIPNSNGQVYLSWTDPDADLFWSKNFTVEVSYVEVDPLGANGFDPVTTGKSGTLTPITKGTQSATVYADNLDSGKMYRFTVTPIDTLGERGYGRYAYEKSGITRSQAPAAVTDLAAATTTNTGEVKLTWTLPNESLTRLEIQWSTGTDTGFSAGLINSDFDVSPAATEYIISGGLPKGVTIYFQVKCYDEGYISPVADTNITLPAPSPVTSASGTAVDNTIVLTWTNPSDADFDYVKITWTAVMGDSGAAYTDNSMVATYTATYLTLGTSYNFILKAVDTAGNESTGVQVATSTLTGVTTVDLTSLITAPVTGNPPVTTGLDETEYTSSTIIWVTTGGDPVGTNFAGGTGYIASFTLTAKDGYTLAGLLANAFSYTGAQMVSYDSDTKTVTIMFNPTDQ